MVKAEDPEVCDYCNEKLDELHGFYYIHRVSGFSREAEEKVRAAIKKEQGYNPAGPPKLCQGCFKKLMMNPNPEHSRDDFAD